ncbi:Arc family DNA-binding protein [Hydrogenophaga sp.]|uniref:Arc family DNA-binding protein n=1 Tax=Hydrogenophaga sp. TaxID=1904254 RepID=UPI00261E7250|nr:Arc family DNA-binding protein [Hydrogenophaga sp.]
MARTDPTIYMRIPEELKEALDTAAAKNKRSLTAEVVDRLEQSFVVRADPPAQGAPTTVVAMLTALEQQLADRHKDETLHRLQYVRQGLATQEALQRDRVERERARLESMEADAEAAEDRGEMESARRLQAKVREERKWLREMESDLERVRLEHLEARERLDAFTHIPATRRRRVTLENPDK